MNIYSIKKIIIASGFEDCEDHNYEVGINGVTEIIDNCVDDQIAFMRIYLIMKDNTLYKSIENCPVSIEYFQEA